MSEPKPKADAYLENIPTDNSDIFEAITTSEPKSPQEEPARKRLTALEFNALLTQSMPARKATPQMELVSKVARELTPQMELEATRIMGAGSSTELLGTPVPSAEVVGEGSSTKWMKRTGSPVPSSEVKIQNSVNLINGHDGLMNFGDKTALSPTVAPVVTVAPQQTPALHKAGLLDDLEKGFQATLEKNFLTTLNGLMSLVTPRILEADRLADERAQKKVAAELESLRAEKLRFVNRPQREPRENRVQDIEEFRVRHNAKTLPTGSSRVKAMWDGICAPFKGGALAHFLDTGHEEEFLKAINHGSVDIGIFRVWVERFFGTPVTKMAELLTGLANALDLRMDNPYDVSEWYGLVSNAKVLDDALERLVKTLCQMAQDACLSRGVVVAKATGITNSSLDQLQPSLQAWVLARKGAEKFISQEDLLRVAHLLKNQDIPLRDLIQALIKQD